MRRVVIFGAGRISRGFLGHLLSLSELPFTFIEKDARLVEVLRRRGAYGIHVMGHSAMDRRVEGYTAYSLDQYEDYLSDLREADLVFTSVGGQNLSSVAGILARVLPERWAHGIERPLNVITCENWISPAHSLKVEVGRLLPAEQAELLEARVGFSEAVVLRSATDPEAGALVEDPAAVAVQDYWSLPVDGATVKGELPSILGMERKAAFAGMLTRKLFTYNAANGSLSYLGHLRGHQRLDEAIGDKEILEVLMRVYDETTFALAKEFGISYEEEYAFSMTSLAKLRNTDIKDYVARNARDPIRKLGPKDRLVGPALLALKYGKQPEGLATAIAAALHYEVEGDPSSIKLRQLREQGGTPQVLLDVCLLGDHPDLIALIVAREAELLRRGWIAAPRMR